jgi:NTE family protein
LLPVALAQPAKPKRVCVTMAGGVARGFAFLGALEELVTSGVPVDCIVGTSAGSLVAGLYASGYSFQTLRDRLPDLQARQTDLVRVISPPINGFLDPAGFEAVFRALVNNQQLEATSPPLAIMVTPLKPGARVPPITTGDLASAMRASISIPLIFPPALLNGEYYTDGGLRDPFPVDAARGLGADIVIGIRALPQPDLRPDNLLNTLTLIVGAAVTPPVQTQPDLWIRVKTYDTLYFDFSRVQELMERGREAARALLPDLKKLLEERGVAMNPPGDPHADNPVNALWPARLEAGLQAARDLPKPFSVAPVLDLSPSSYDAGTLPDARSGFSSIGVGLDVSGGPLGRFSVGAGYINSLDTVEDTIFARIGFNLEPWRFSASYDPARRAIGAPWQLEARFNPGAFDLALTLDSAAFSVATSTRFSLGTLTLEPRLNLRFGYAPSLRLETSLAARFDFEPWFLRSRVLLGLTTGGAERFSLGSNSLLRAYGLNYTLSPQAIVANLELGHRFRGVNLGGLVSLEPELRAFADFGWAINVNAGSSQFLWDLGVGVSLPGRWIGFLPFSVGFDVAFGPPGVRFNLFTGFPLP